MRITRSGWQVAGIATACAVAVGLALALSEMRGRDLVGQALGPVALLSEPSTDDVAGDPLVPGVSEHSLPVPAPLDDDRVVAALAPLADLSCHRNDAPEGARADSGSARERLDEPLASYAPPSALAATGPLLAAAAAPIALVTAPAPHGNPAAVEIPAGCPALLRHQFNRLQTGEPQSLCQFQGKVLLVVNTASYCGYTNQYEGLEALYRKYKGRGLVVVGFPSNDFGGQEPGTNTEIARFCRLTYGVQFPMFEKTSVTKVSDNPLFASLSASTGVAPKWNFYKYVVDRSGQPIAAYASRTTPSDPELVRTIERLLAERPKD